MTEIRGDMDLDRVRKDTSCCSDGKYVIPVESVNGQYLELSKTNAGEILRVKAYYQNGLLHNTRGPAKAGYRYDVEGEQVIEEHYYIGGVRHRFWGAASIVRQDGSSSMMRMWYHRGKLHSYFGAAVIRYKMRIYYWHGRHCATFSEYLYNYAASFFSCFT